MKLLRADFLIYFLVIILFILTVFFSGSVVDIYINSNYYNIFFEDFSIPVVIFLLFEGALFTVLILNKRYPNFPLSIAFSILNIFSIVWFIKTLFLNVSFPRRYYSFTNMPMPVADMKYNIIVILGSFILAQLLYILSLIKMKKINVS